MSAEAQIWFLLSLEGRKRSLLQGGTGEEAQALRGTPEEGDIDLFGISPDGKRVVLDLRVLPEQPKPIIARYTWQNISGQKGYSLLWNVVPTWADLIAFARARQQEEDNELQVAYQLHLADEAEKQKVGEAFLANPLARAQSLDNHSALIEGHRFYSDDDPVKTEAVKRAAQDEENLKVLNRITMANWTRTHGTDNQRQRLNAQVLPWQEVYASIEERLFAPLSDFPLYERFSVEEVCQCSGTINDEGDRCKVKFKSVDTNELGPEEWEVMSKIMAVVPGAIFQYREHQADCEIRFAPLVRKGVIVKFNVDNLKFKREYALTAVKS